MSAGLHDVGDRAEGALAEAPPDRLEAGLAELELPEEVEKRVREEVDRFRLLPIESPESGVVRTRADLSGSSGPFELVVVARDDPDRPGEGDEQKTMLVVSFTGDLTLTGHSTAIPVSYNCINMYTYIYIYI